MEEVKKTRKKPTAKKTVQSVDVAAEELEKTTQPEVAVTAEPNPNAEDIAEKPIKKKSAKSTKQPEKEDVAERIPETDAPIAEEQEGVEDRKTEEPIGNDETKGDEHIHNTEEQLADGNNEAAEEHDAEAQEPQIDTEKPIGAKKKKKIIAESEPSGKKFKISKKMLIILSCVLVAVILAIVLSVTLTSCNSNNTKSGSGNKTNAKSYTVTFDTKGGSEIESVTLYEGDKVTRPTTNPTKEMFTFDDWYIVNPNNQGEMLKFVFDTAISQDITLVAGWRGENSVKVEFDANGGAFADDKEVVMYGLIGSTMSAPADAPTRYGYKFGGWYEDKECHSKFNFGVFPIDNATLYAGWDKDPDYVYVTYYGNGELLYTEPLKKTEDLVLPDELGNDTVVGNWYTNVDMTEVYDGSKPTDSLSLYTTYYTKGLKFNKGMVTGYTGTATDVIVPTKYNGTPVYSIGADAFYRTSELPAITSIKLPDGIRTIGSGAFYNCQYLASINLTESVQSIGVNAFYRNERLRTLGDISGVMTIGDGAFNGCKQLRDFEFGNDLFTIGEYAFNDCVLLTNVTLTASVEYVGENAFSGCTSLKTVVAESMVLKNIGKNAFADCASLTEITIENSSDAVVFGGNPVTNSRNVTIYVPSALLDAYKENSKNAQFKDKFAAIR